MTQITKKDKSFRIVIFPVPKLSLKPKLRIALIDNNLFCVWPTQRMISEMFHVMICLLLFIMYRSYSMYSMYRSYSMHSHVAQVAQLFGSSHVAQVAQVAFMCVCP